ncbi:MAG: hypothetical protein HY810_03630 [Candidatus Omnitrophica bacterium]|nr:hypothetical protein [Candidatus Omnitrophota bacterium]
MKSLGLFAVLFMAFMLSFSGQVVAQEKVIKEIIVQVNSDVIALPDGDAANIPISAVRIRSSELRDLNQTYNAVSLEKLYVLETAMAVDKQMKKKDFKGETLKTEKVEQVDSPINIGLVFSKEMKKQEEEKGNKVLQMDNAYIIQLEVDPGQNMTEVATAYKALPVVIYADPIIRSK